MPLFTRTCAQPKLEVFHNSENSVQLDPSSRTTLSHVLDAMSCLKAGQFRQSRIFRVLPGSGILQTVRSTFQRDPKGRHAMPVAGSERFLLVDFGSISIRVSTYDGPVTTPIVIASHGVGGEWWAAYLQEILKSLGLTASAGGLGWRTISLNLRGCGDNNLTSPQMHHPGHIHDLGAVVASAQQQFPGAPIYLLGASLGAALVQNYLAEMGDEAPVSGAMVLSPVWDFAKSKATMEGDWIHRKLNNAVGGEMHAMFNRNKRVFTTEHAEAVSAVTSPVSSRQATPISTPLSTPNSSPMSTPPPSLASYSSSEDIQPFASAACSPRLEYPTHNADHPIDPKVMLENVRTLARSGKLSLTEFSDKIIAPTAGYATAEEFVNATSSVHGLHKIKVPMLCLNANDDPLLGGDDLPRDQASLSEHVAMVVTRFGGHLGWFGRGKDGKRPEFKRWSSRVAVEFFEELNKLQLPPPPQLRIVEGRGILKGYLHPEGRPMQAFMKISALFTRIVITPPDRIV